ncbi:MAG: DUF4209 domain-containing protein [Acidimicrobiia bacterium]
MEAERAAEVARLLDEAALQEWDDNVAVAIERLLPDDDGAALGLAFRFYVSQEDGSRHRWRPLLRVDPNGNQVETGLADLDEPVIRTWEAVVSLAVHPRVRARLHDLLFERRSGDVGAHAREAINSYLTVALTPSSTVAEVDAITRAFDLIALTRQPDFLPEATNAAITAVDGALASTDAKPGVSLRILEVLVDARIADGRVDDRLLRCRTAYPDQWNTEHTIGLQLRRESDEGARAELQRERVLALFTEADASEPMVAVSHLARAAALARELAISDLHEEAVRRLQGVDPTSLSMHRIETPIEIPRAEIEAYLDQLLAAPTWLEAVVSHVLAGPPSGNVHRNRATVQELTSEFPLQNLFPTVRVGADGLPRSTAETPEERAEASLANHEVMAMQLSAMVLVELLERAGVKFGEPRPEDLAPMTEHASHVDQATGDAIARVIRRFYQADPEAAAYTGIPLIERLTRNLLLQLRVPLFRVERDNKPGQYPGMGALLHELGRSGLDPSWHRYLYVLLVAPHGLNLRNEAMHGFAPELGAGHAALVIAGLLYLAVQTVGPVGHDG